MNRRKFLRRMAQLGGLGILTGVYAWQVEPLWYKFEYVDMPIPNLPDKLIDKTLIQISDIHIGDRFDYSYIIEAFKETQKLNPDFVVYTGDYVNYEGVKQLEQLDEVCRNIVKGRLGTFGVLGNHDYGAQWSQMEVANRIAQTLHKYGVEVLRNSSMQKAGLNFIGIDDYWGLNFNPEKAMRNLDLEKANIVLCHNPDVMDLDVWKGYNSWVLSGHTHGGQVKVPFLPPFILPVKNKRYSAGKIDMEDGRTLYINRALGHLRQVRFNVRPEITVFKLKKVEA